MTSSPQQRERMMQSALAHHQANNLASAQQIYSQLLATEPSHAQALHFSGLLAHRKGNSSLALDLIMRSLQIEPGNTTFLLNLAQVLESGSDTASAIEICRRALAIDPRLQPAHHRLGNLLLSAGQLDEAAASYSRALVLKPDSAEVIHSLGALLRQAGRIEASITCFRKALVLHPAYAEAHSNLALSLQELGQLPDAIAHCRQAIVLKPGMAAAHCNLAGMLLSEGMVAAAAESSRYAIQLDANLTEAHLNLGNALRRQGRLSDAIGSYQRAIELSPSTAAGAYNNLAETLKDQDKLPEAIAAFEAAIALQPGFAGAYSNLLYMHAFTRDIPPEAERALAQGWERYVLTEAELAAARQRAPVSSGAFHPRGDKLRIGILSAELGTHAVAEFLEPVLEALDRTRFHLTLFPTSRHSGVRADHFRSLADSFIPLIGVSDSAAGDRIRSERIDVLIDTTGHTFGGRLAISAHRAAPVQCSYLGYWSTTGLTEMDWIFADPFFSPNLNSHFTEALWPLPRITFCYRGDTSLAESRWRPDPTGTIWIGSFNKFSKIRAATLALWAQVLRALPEARLLLEDAGEYEQETHQRILCTLASHGVPAERVEFIPFIAGHEHHMRLYDRLDIALDTIPFNSVTTAFDALWMGVPLVSLEGDWLGGRFCSTVLKSMGREAWVAHTEAEYVAIIRDLARDIAGRIALRRTQRAEMAAGPLCDAPALARALEDAFEAMHLRWSQGIAAR